MSAALIRFPGRSTGAAPVRRPAINNRQKALLHIYAHAAALSQGEYRAILMRATGCPSAADPRFSQRNFDAAMAALEGELAVRVETRRVPPPPRRQIPRLDYWRGKVPASGHANIRQRHAIEEGWARLAQYLGTAATQEYLLGIIHKATGRRDLPHRLTSSEAGLVIDALKSRLAVAIRPAAQDVGLQCSVVVASPEHLYEEVPCPF